MRFLASCNSAAVQTRTLAAVVLLAAVVGLVAILINRSPTKPTQVEAPPGPAEMSRTNLVLEEGRLRQSEASIMDGKLHGAFRQWHPNGALSEQVEFVADQPEGVSRSYFPSGYLKGRVVMKDGKPVEQTFWKDGEKKD